MLAQADLSCDEGHRVSHETIYRSLFIQARGALKKELLEHLRRTRGMRRSRHYTQKTAIHGQIADAASRSVRERPACVEDRAVPGHWEGDLVFGSGNSQIATLVERQTRYVMLVKLDGKDTQTVVNALIKHARKLPQGFHYPDLGPGHRDACPQAIHLGHGLFRSVSVIRKAHGSGEVTRTRMGCSGAVHAQGHEPVRAVMINSTR